MNLQSKYYILCIANLRSGGPEALHQLRYYMEQVGLDAYLVYYDTKEGIDPMPEPYGVYGIKRKTMAEVVDEKHNIVISAESSTIVLNRFKHLKKYIWWLSVNWFDYKPLTTSLILKHYYKKLLGKNSDISSYCNFSLDSCMQVCGSKYAYEYVTKLGLKASYMVEPISKVFLEADNNSDYVRNDVVLYNPAKPSDIMTKLLDQNRFKFKPLTQMTTTELIEAYKHAKLYIDFGHFGGPERMPKEAVYFGCCILVGNRNAAVNGFDVAIPDEYKITDYNNLQLVGDKIEYLLDNYVQCIANFEPFKSKISLLEQNFKMQINNIFVKYKYDSFR